MSSENVFQRIGSIKENGMSDNVQTLHSSGDQPRKRKNVFTETIDLSNSTDDEDISTGDGQSDAPSHLLPFSNKARKMENEHANTFSNDAIIHDSKRYARSNEVVKTYTEGSRDSKLGEYLLPNNVNQESNNSNVHSFLKDTSDLSSYSRVPTMQKSDFGRIGNSGFINSDQENVDEEGKIEFSKSSFLGGVKSSVGVMEKANDANAILYNDSDDSSSSSSDLRQFMRLDAGFSSKSFSNEIHPKAQPISENCNNFVDTLDSDSDSSLEILNAPYHGFDSPSPNGRRRNPGSHLCGRQRRLEAARSKNLDGGGKSSDTASSDISGMITNDIDDNNSPRSSDNDEEKNSSNSKVTPEISSEAMLSTSDATAFSPTKSSDFFSTNEIVDSKYCGRKARSENESGTLIVECKMTTKETSEIVDKTVEKNKSEFSTVNRSIDSKPLQMVDQITADKIFDNLYCNGKDFISWAKINDPKEFLIRNDLSQLVNSWREKRNLPPFNDSVGYLSRLKNQVRNNMKSMGIEISANDEDNNPIAKPLIRDAVTVIKNKVHPSLTNLPMKGENFIQSVRITNPEDFLQRKNLGKLVNPWRQQLNLPVVKDPNWYISKWKKIIREREGMHPSESITGVNDNFNKRESENNDFYDCIEDEFPDCMTVASALSKRFLNDETGLPVYQFGIYDQLAGDTIYEFRVEAKKSLIEGAGNGAFLTFLGARERRQNLSKIGDNLSQVKTIHPLIAKDSDGFHTNLKIVGEHLHRQNKQYPVPTNLPPMYVLSKYCTKEKYPWNIGSEGNRILNEYVENPHRIFSTKQSGCSTIDLGRYGPFRRSDRKVLVHYEIKNFIFSNEVSEWGFDLREDLRGEEQVADITDDTTGIPHNIARQNISMYVNETGGDPKLKQTVFSGQVLDREVNYYFKTERAMRKGETIELLISYLHTYDEIRERKGYGERNKIGAVLGDDHFPTYLERNFVERYDMVEVIYEIKDEMDLYQLSEFLDGIREKLANLMDTFITELQASSEIIHVPYVQQMIALRRLNWLKPYFVNKIESFKKSFQKRRKNDISSCLPLVLQQCTENAQRLNWPSWPIFLDLLDKHPKLVDNKGINVRSKFREEVTEDICYGVNDSLLCPCHEAIWCGVTANLIHDLCFEIARNSWDYRMVKPLTNLTETLVQKTIEASKAVMSPDNLDLLTFDMDASKKYSLKSSFELSEQPRGSKCVMALVEDSKNSESKLPMPIILSDDSSLCRQQEIMKMIHKPWYLSRQIIFVADAFAKKYIGKNEKAYSREDLCKMIDGSLEFITIFFNVDVKLDLTSSLFYGKDFKAIYSKGNKLNDVIKRTGSDRKTHKTGSKSMPVRKLLFWNIIVDRLKGLGWKIDLGSRPSDWYLLPPGVERGKGFKPRVDFFDSAPLVIQCLKTNRKYCNLPQIKQILVEYHLCQLKYEEMKAARDKFIKNSPADEIVDFLKKSMIDENQPHGKNSCQQRNPVSTEVETKTQDRRRIKSVIFKENRLGLMLVKDGGKVVVKDVSNHEFKDRINPGDVLVSVGDKNVRNSSLSNIVELLAKSERPLNVKLESNV